MEKIRAYLREYHPIVHSLIVGTVFVRAASSMSMPFLFIYLSKHTNMTLSEIGLTIGAGSLFGMLGGFVGGTLSDKFGRRVIMLGALYTWSLVFLGFAYGDHPYVFFLLNGLSGLCRSFYEPVSQALMADLTPSAKRYRVFALRYTAINVGVAVGPLVGAVLALNEDSLPFLVTAIAYLLYVVFLQLLLNRFGIKQIEGQKKEIVSFAKAINVVSHDKAFGLYILGSTLGAISYSQMSTTLAKFVEITVHDGVQLFAVLMSVNAVVVVLMQLPLTKWAERRTPLQSIFAGNVLYAIGNVGFAYSQGWTLFILAMTVFTLGEVLSMTTSDVFIDRLAPEDLRGAYYGARSFSHLGTFIGPWMGGFLLHSCGGTSLFITVALVTLVSTIFYWLGEKQYAASRSGKQLLRMTVK